MIGWRPHASDDDFEDVEMDRTWNFEMSQVNLFRCNSDPIHCTFLPLGDVSCRSFSPLSSCFSILLIGYFSKYNSKVSKNGVLPEAKSFNDDSSWSVLVEKLSDPHSSSMNVVSFSCSHAQWWWSDEIDDPDVQIKWAWTTESAWEHMNDLNI